MLNLLIFITRFMLAMVWLTPAMLMLYGIVAVVRNLT